IMRKLAFLMIAQAQAIFGNAQRMPPLHALRLPEFIPFLRFIRMAEPLHLHLLKLARAENEIPRRDFIAKAFSNLRHTEWDFHARGVDDVLEVQEDSLSSFRAQISFRLVTDQC